MTKALSRVLLLAAAGLSGLAGYLAVRLPEEPPPFEVDEPDQDLGELAVGGHEVVFRIRNPADRPRRIIGLQEG